METFTALVHNMSSDFISTIEISRRLSHLSFNRFSDFNESVRQLKCDFVSSFFLPQLFIVTTSCSEGTKKYETERQFVRFL